MTPITKDDLSQVMRDHIGREKAVSASYLALALGVNEREVRHLVTELRDEGVAVCGHPSNGYFIAESPEEIEQTCQFLRSRAMHSLALEAKLRKVALPDLLGQMNLKT